MFSSLLIGGLVAADIYDYLIENFGRLASAGLAIPRLGGSASVTRSLSGSHLL